MTRTVEPYRDPQLPERFLRWIETLRQRVGTVPCFTYFDGSPEGVIDGQKGDLYYDRSGNDYYQKTSDTGNTGWVPFATGLPTTTLQEAYDQGQTILIDNVPNPVAITPSVAGDVLTTVDLSANPILTVIDTGVIAGDPGLEGTGILINGVLYDSVFKSSEIGGTNIAQTILHRHSSTFQPLLVAARSQGDTDAHVILNGGDFIFSIVATGWDGASYAIAGDIEFRVDGTPALDDMPGLIAFSTTASGAESATERVRIRSTGLTEFDFPIDLAERAAVLGAPVAGRGQFWVRDDAPNTPMFTDDTGVDSVLNATGGQVDSVSGGTNINVSGTAVDPIVNLDAAITGTSVNGVTLTTAGAATNYLDETGSYSVPAGAGGFQGLGQWRYRTATGSSPSSGQLQFDNTTISSATEMYVNETNDNGVDVSAFLALIVANDLIYVQVSADSSQYVIVQTDTPTSAAGVYTFPILLVEGVGSSPTNNTPVSVVTAGGGGGALPASTVDGEFLVGDTGSFVAKGAPLTWTPANGLTVSGSVGSSSPPTTAPVDSIIRFAALGGSPNLAYLGFIGANDVYLVNEMRAGEVFIRATKGSGAVSTLIRANSESDVKLHYNGAEVARTETGANGGFEVFNTSTGIGFERVLTTGDLPSGGGVGISGTPNNNQLAVWIGATDVEGEADLTYADPKFLINGVVNLIERAAPVGNVATQGQIWVRDDVPNTLMFTDDGGNDHDLTAGGGSTVSVVRKTSNETVNNSTTEQQDNELNGIALVSGQEYLVEAELRFLPNTNTMGMKASFILASGSWNQRSWSGTCVTNNVTPHIYAAGGHNNAIQCNVVPALTITFQNHVMRIRAYLTTSTAATLELRWAQNTAIASNLTLLTGSFMVVTAL